MKKYNKMKKSKLTVEEVHAIVRLRKKGLSYSEIGKELNYSAGYCCDIYRAYNLHEPIRKRWIKKNPNLLKIIDEASREDSIKYPIYECKILFGFFTLKLKPKN